MTTYKFEIEKTTIEKGFSIETSTSVTVDGLKLTDSIWEEIMREKLGVDSWCDVPESLRRNGRKCPGRLCENFEVRDLFDEADRDAIKACVQAAAERTKTIEKTIIFEV